MAAPMGAEALLPFAAFILPAIMGEGKEGRR